VPTRSDKRGVGKDRIGVWKPSTIFGVITNEAYTGIWHYGKTKVVRQNGRKRQVPVPKEQWQRVEITPLVDRETFDAVQHALQQRKTYSKRNTRRDYLLRQLVTCACGATCITGIHRGKEFYRCPVRGYAYQHECRVRYYAVRETLDNAVWSLIRNRLLDRTLIEQQVARQRELVRSRTDELNNKLSPIDREIRENQRKQSMLMQQLLVGTVDQAVLDEHMQVLAAQLADLRSRRKKIDDDLVTASMDDAQVDAIAVLAEQLKTVMDDLPFERRRQLVELLQVRVQVQPDRTVVVHSVLSPVSLADKQFAPSRNGTHIDGWPAKPDVSFATVSGCKAA
jgi:site-specific DNA recombinase